MAQREEQEDWELQVENCRIELWRGYLTANFLARALDGENAGAVVGSSSPFRWRSTRPPDTEEARLAHYEIVAALKAAGWSPGGAAGEWYETDLARPTLVPPRPASDPVAEVPVETAPVEEAPVAREPALEVHEPPPPLVPATVAPAAAPAPAGDRWRIVAAAGLLAAIAFLVVLALHG